MLGLRRLKVDAIWLEHMPSEGNARDDQRKIDNFQRQLRAHGFSGRYCLLYQKTPDSTHDLNALRCIGISKQELLDRLAGPNTLLNLSYSIHPPLLLKFECRIFCDLDPSEIIYWMTQMEMGQSSHHEFWTIGLNVNDPDCKLLKTVTAALTAAPSQSQATRSEPDWHLPLQKIRWKTFYPLVDTKLYRPQPRPRSPKFTTIGQWYWSGAVEIDGTFPDLSKKYAFERYLDLPKRVVEAKFESGISRHGSTSCDGGHSCGKIFAACERLSFCWQIGRSRGCDRRSAGELATPLARGASICGRSLRFGEKSPENSRPLNRSFWRCKTIFGCYSLSRYGRFDESARA